MEIKIFSWENFQVEKIIFMNRNLLEFSYKLINGRRIIILGIYKFEESKIYYLEEDTKF